MQVYVYTVHAWRIAHSAASLSVDTCANSMPGILQFETLVSLFTRSRCDAATL
jgi:hypothetical protein